MPRQFMKAAGRQGARVAQLQPGPRSSGLIMMLTRSMQVLIVLGTCFVVLRTRLLASYHVMPLNKLLLVCSL